MKLSNLKIDQILFYVACAMPFAIIFGVFIADLSLVILSIIFLFKFIKEKMWHILNHPFSILFIIFYLYLIIISLFSKDIIQSLEYSLFYFRYLFFVLALQYIISTFPNFIKLFSKLLFISFVIVVIDSYVQFFLGYNILLFERPGDRLSSFFKTEPIVGSYLSKMFPIVLAFYFFNNSSNIKSIRFFILTLIFIVSTFLIVYLSGERSAFLLMLLSFVLVVFFVRRYKLIKFSSLILSLTVIVYVTVSNINIKNRMIDTTLKQLNLINIFSIELDENFISKHPNINDGTYGPYIASSIKMFKDNVFFGQGPKMYRSLCDNEKFYFENSCSTHPHNIYLQLLAETGLIGFLFVFISFLYVCISLALSLFNSLINNNKNLTNYQLCLFISILISLWPIIPTGSFFNNWVSIIVFLPIPFLIQSFKNK